MLSVVAVMFFRMASKRALYLFREAQYHEAETRILELRSANYETTVALTIVAPLLTLQRKLGSRN